MNSPTLKALLREDEDTATSSTRHEQQRLRRQPATASQAWHTPGTSVELNRCRELDTVSFGFSNTEPDSLAHVESHAEPHGLADAEPDAIADSEPHSCVPGWEVSRHSNFFWRLGIL